MHTKTLWEMGRRSKHSRRTFARVVLWISTDQSGKHVFTAVRLIKMWQLGMLQTCPLVVAL